MKKSIFGVGLLLSLLIFSGAICKSKDTSPSTIVLKYWSVVNSDADLRGAFDAFAVKYPYIQVEYRQLNIQNYEDELISAWAQGEGPDIFSIPNSHLGKFEDLIEPMPATIAITSVETKESLGQKELVVTPQTLSTISVQQLGSSFPQVVSDDVVMVHKATSKDKATEKIFALPLSMDTMVLYYNKDMLSQAKIALPPETWDQFVEQVPRLTLVDIDNNIIQSGAALGTSNNIPRSFDIISLLMLQNGAVMTSGSNVTFQTDLKERRGYNPGNQAVEFYTSFANPDVEWYSWNADQSDALESFIDGDTAFYFGYHYDLKQINNRAPNLNFDLAPMPQVNINNNINYANYWLETVSINSKVTDEAWALIEAITTENAKVKKYLTATKKPSALKTLLEEQKEDYVLSVFADQSLTAQSWYAGSQPKEVEDQFADMITIINEGRLDVNTAVKNTASKVALTYD
ncbi:MAG: extracellular solute-binding protein [bacterium]|nr:extracellular solute-binding protein [bacterium]